MISKQQIKFIKSLAHKKYRKKHRMYVAEGTKIVDELLQSNAKVYKIFALGSWIARKCASTNTIPQDMFEEIQENELAQISELTTPNEVLALVHIPDEDLSPFDLKSNEMAIALESVRDPGNLGTIIRLADWYGLSHIICSPDCVDNYSSKVVQASMGSIARVNVIYTDLFSFFTKSTNKIPVYAALLDGSENLHKIKSFTGGILLIGNESRGISEELASLANHKVSIPAFGKADSLNAAIATGIFLDNFKRLLTVGSGQLKVVMNNKQS